MLLLAMLDGVSVDDREHQGRSPKPPPQNQILCEPAIFTATHFDGRRAPFWSAYPQTRQHLGVGFQQKSHTFGLKSRGGFEVTRGMVGPATDTTQAHTCH